MPPLAVPDLAVLPPPEQLAKGAAVALFLARVRALDPTFVLTPANSADVAVLCARLEGLPLALELAAARIRVLSPAQLLARVDRRLALLIDGPRDLPPRQRTLRATLDWSFALLDLGERLLLGRLAVFADAFSLAAGEAVATAVGPTSVPVLDGLQVLLDNHLLLRVNAPTSEPRFAMLEVVREYALERLTSLEEAPAARGAHAAYFLALAERVAPTLDGPEQVSQLNCLDNEHANLNVALDWLLSAGDVARAARLAGALHGFWHLRGYLAEGRVWLDRVFACDGIDPPSHDQLPPRVGARARFAAALLAVDQGDLMAARAHIDLCTELWQSLGASIAADREARRSLIRSLSLRVQVRGMLDGEIDPAEITEIHRLAHALGDRDVEAEVAANHGRGLLQRFGDLAAARRELLRAQAIIHDHGGPHHLAQGLRIDLGMIALWTGDTLEACDHFAAALAAARSSRDRAFEALAENNLGEAARLVGSDEEAAAHYEASLRLYRSLGSRTEFPRLIHNLGYLALRAGDTALARERFVESLAGFGDIEMVRGLAEATAGLAAVAACVGTPEAARQAARLWGAAAVALNGEGRPVWPADQAEWIYYQALARAVLGADAFHAAKETGRGLLLATAVSEARTV